MITDMWDYFDSKSIGATMMYVLLGIINNFNGLLTVLVGLSTLGYNIYRFYKEYKNKK